MEVSPNTSTAQSRYTMWEAQRQVYLDRGYDASRLTIPSLLPPLGHNSTTPLYKPWQSLGARGVNNLASKLLLALYPTNSPFFRMQVDPAAADRMASEPKFKTEVDKALSKYERIIMVDIEASGDRVAIFEALKHLIVTGNVLLYISLEGIKVFHLDRYVVKRDPMGAPIEIIVKESFSPASLPENVKAIMGGQPSDAADKTVDVFTHVCRKANQWFVYQECRGQRVPGSEGQYPLDKNPWLALRLIRIDGEDYGRGYVEEYQGDLQSLEALSKAIVEGAAASAKVLFLVKPNSTTRVKTLAEAPNGAIREGNAEDVTTLQVQKYADFRVARETMDKIEERLGFAFLLNTSIQRNGERVTAEEIRYMAQELDDGLGGVYSILTQEFQLPYVNRKIAVLTRSGKLPRLPKGLIRIAIITGLEALGRGHDRTRLVGYMATLQQTIGPEGIARNIDTTEYAKRLALADGIDPDGLLKTPEQIAQDDQQRQQQSLIGSVTPEVVKQAGGAFQKGMQLNGNQQQQ